MARDILLAVAGGLAGGVASILVERFFRLTERVLQARRRQKNTLPWMGLIAGVTKRKEF